MIQIIINNISNKVRATLLTGLSLATNAVIDANDSVLSAFGKLQAQITNIISGDMTFSGLKTFAREIILTPISTPTHTRGKLYFDDVNDCLSYMDSISGRSTQIGYEVLMAARNNTGSTITNGQVVYVSGAIGNNSTIALAQANAEATSVIIGMATHDIANNSIGRVVITGLANDLNTSAFSDGDEVFLSSTVAGGLTTTPPASPNFVIKVGVVERSHVTLGKIMVRPAMALSNNNSLGTSHKVAVTQNAVKTYIDNEVGKEISLDLWVGNSTTTNQAETILRTIPVVGGVVDSTDLVWITEQVSSSQTSGTLTVRARIGTSAVPVDITLETLVLNSLASTATAGGIYVPINNYIHFSGGNIVCAARAFLSPSGGVQITDVTSPTLSATWYIYITSQKSIAGGTVSLRSSLIKRERA